MLIMLDLLISTQNLGNDSQMGDLVSPYLMQPLLVHYEKNTCIYYIFKKSYDNFLISSQMASYANPFD